MEEGAPDPQALVNATTMLGQVDTLLLRIGEKEAELAQLKAQLKDIVQARLPEAMTDARIPKFTTSNGTQIELIDVVAGTWPTDEQKVEQAIHWLEQEKLTDLLKTTITVEFDRGDAAAAKEFFESVRGNNAKKAATMKQAVHASTLSAEFRRRLKAGKHIPVEIFNGYVAKAVKIKEPS